MFIFISKLINYLSKLPVFYNIYQRILLFMIIMVLDEIRKLKTHKRRKIY